MPMHSSSREARRTGPRINGQLESMQLDPKPTADQRGGAYCIDLVRAGTLVVDTAGARTVPPKSLCRLRLAAHGPTAQPIKRLNSSAAITSARARTYVLIIASDDH